MSDEFSNTHPTIKFRRHLRDCPWNKDPGRTPQTMLYDFDVIIDGELRAILIRQSGKGYRLCSPDRLPVRAKEVPAQAAFRPVIFDALVVGAIPTTAEIADARRLATEKAAADQAAQERIRRVYDVRHAAPELWHAATDLIEANAMAPITTARLREIRLLIEQHRQGVAEIEEAEAKAKAQL